MAGKFGKPLGRIEAGTRCNRLQAYGICHLETIRPPEPTSHVNREKNHPAKGASLKQAV